MTAPPSFPALLRSSDRLARLLSSKSLAFYHPEMTHVREAEFDWESAEARDSSFDFSMLNRLYDDNAKNGFSCSQKWYSGMGIKPWVGGNALPDHSAIDILWISSTEYLTFRELAQTETAVAELLYTVNVNLVNSLILAYRLKPHEHDVSTDAAAPAECSLRFMAHLLTPIADMITEIRLVFWTPPPVETTLSMVPTSKQRMVKNMSFALEGASRDLLQALASHPIHPRVLLQLDGQHEHEQFFTKLELNRLLLQFRFPVHLQVPELLFDLKTTEEMFTANPAFESLTIAAHEGKKVSPKLLDGIAFSNIKNLTIGSSAWDWKCCENGPGWMDDLLRRVVLGHFSSIESLTLVSQYNFFGRHYRPFKKEQESFDRLSRNIGSIAWHGMSSFHFSFPCCLRNTSMKSNDIWDSRVSPSLLLNWLSHQGGGCLPSKVSGLAVRKINQGALYRLATNLLPSKLGASSASSIFLVVHRGMSRKEIRVKARVVGCANSDDVEC
jgi:hypothetical protein